MAEFALGLTKTAVEGTLSRVKSVIEEEGKQRERVQEDLVFITGEFQMMQAFLNASSAKEHASRNPVARAWVRQLRDLAFDVENCVEFVVHLDKPSPLDWVQRLAASLPCLARPLLPLDVAVADIKRLRARVEDVSQRNTRYNLMAGGGDNDGENRHQQLLMPPAVAGGHISAPGAETFPILRDAWMAMGKLCHTTGDLRKLIDCQGSELRVISLWGSAHADFPGELGWASIVKTAYEDPQICKQFKSRAWIKLTNPFNPAEFLNNLLAHFTSHRHVRHDDMSKLMLQVSQHKYLIILDQELSSVADWEAIKKCLPDGNTGSRIIVSTKLLGIARGCTGEPFQVWELQRFSHDRYLCAIFSEGCGHRIGVAEFIWQLKRRPGVMSLCFDTYVDKNLLASELFAQDGDTQRLRVVDEVKFEHQYVHTSKSQDGKFNVERYEDDKFDLADLADSILKEYSREDEIADSEWDEFKGMSRRGKIETCRKFLTEHEWLVYIDEGVQSPADWDLIKEELLCESTSSCIVVITDNPSVAKHCVGHQQHLALNVEDLLNKGSDERCQSRHAGGEGNIIIKEEGESESESESESDSDSEAESEPEPDRLPGRKEEADFIRWPMISASSFECVTLLSVWGIAGVGKSAVVRQVYDDRDELEHKRYGWVDAPHPFSLTVLCQRLLLNFYLDDPHAKEAAAIGMVEGHDPVQMCCKILRQKRCFLVIDDLRSTHDWDLIQAALFPDPNIGGATVVITREESIARHCAHREEDILNVKGLQPDVALDLFKKISLDGKKSSEIPPDAEKISKLVTSKCGGIPEVIVAVGKLARAYQGEIRTLENINVEFMRELDTPQSSSSLRGLFCWMQSYFDECSDELKPCIFYMSIFPAEESVRRRRLLRRWIAEGYSSRGDGTAEEKAEKLLSKLMKLSIFYKSQKSCTTTSCKVNGFFHEYIKSRPMEDNLVFELTGSCGPRSGLTGQHLTISSSWDRDETVFKSIDLSRLRSLTVFGKWVPFLINSDNLKMLRALDLEDTSSTPESDGTGVVTDADLEIIGKLLTRLKFLSLRRCKKVTRLPDSFGGMRQLETLDVRHTRIVELPPCVITKLHKLQYIRAGNTETIRPQEEAVAAPMPAPTETPPAPITTTTQEDVHSGTSPFLQATAAAPVLAGGISGAWKSRAHALVESSSGSSWWESKKQRRRRVRVAANGGGVEVARAATEGIGKLTELHTLGVVNIAGAKFGLLLLKELKQLTQLRKLGLSGINRGNWSALCLAVSGYLPHLESLSLQLLLLEGEPSYEFACFDNISEPPKTLKSLKVLYTSALCAGACGAYIKPAWISKLPNLIKFDHGSTVSSQEDIDFLLSNGFPSGLLEKRLHVKTVRQHLSFDRPQSQVVSLGVLMIDCSSSSSLVTFAKSYTFSVPVIRIRCCSTCGGMSCLRIVGLQHVHRLEHVLVTGPCSRSFEEDLRKQLGENLCYPKPEMKLLG